MDSSVLITFTRSSHPVCPPPPRTAASSPLSLWCPMCVGNTVWEDKVGVPLVAQWRGLQLGSMRLQVGSLASLSGLKIRYCHELWCRSQIGFGSCVAVALV